MEAGGASNHGDDQPITVSDQATAGVTVGTSLGEFSDYAGFQRLLRARAEALGISRSTLDAVCGMHDGHAGKMLSDPPSKNMGITTMGWLMQGLAVKCVLLTDEEQLVRIASRLQQRDANNGAVLALGKHPTIEIRISRRALKKMAAKGGQARAAKLSKRRRVAIARAAARARWGRSRG